MKLASKSSKAF